MSARRRLGALVLACALVGTLGACSRKKPVGAPAVDESASVVVKESSEGLLLTWIDEKGDFHVEQRVADVPIVGRDAVRVVDPNKDEGTHDARVLVADLRNARADGTFGVTPMTRADFDALAIARRQKVGPTLAAAGGAANPAGGARDLASAPAGSVEVAQQAPIVIYGASWCGPCHQAAAYLRSKNIAFIDKDIDQDAAAARDMQRKLAKSGMRTGSIPVIDIRGKILVGFNPRDIDAALGKSS